MSVKIVDEGSIMLPGAILTNGCDLHKSPGGMTEISPKLSYREQLLDPRWLARRMEIIRTGNYRCEDCSSPFPDGGAGLQVHHCYYIRGRLAWEYPDDCLMPLCDPCHKLRQGRQDAAFMQFGRAMRRMSKLELENAVWLFLANQYLRPFHE